MAQQFRLVNYYNLPRHSRNDFFSSRMGGCPVINNSGLSTFTNPWILYHGLTIMMVSSSWFIGDLHVIHGGLSTLTIMDDPHLTMEKMPCLRWAPPSQEPDPAMGTSSSWVSLGGKERWKDPPCFKGNPLYIMFSTYIYTYIYMYIMYIYIYIILYII